MHLKEREHMRVGYYQKNITPQEPVYMAGYNRKDKSRGVLDEILLNTLVWDINHQKIVFVIIDAIMLEKKFCDDLRNDIHRKFDIKMNNIFISCIHTHSAPAYFQLIWEDTIVEEGLLIDLYYQSIHSVEKALIHLRDCQVNLKKCIIEGLYGNRNNKEGWSDKSVYVFEFVDHNEVICQFINIAVHPTILNGENHLLSSDLLGAVRRQYQNITQVPTLICNGATGDVSTRFYRQYSGVKELKRVSHEIVEQMLKTSQYIFKNKVYQTFRTTQTEYVTHSDFSKDNVTITTLQSHNQDPMLNFFKERCKRKLALNEFDLLMNSITIQLGQIFIISLPGDVVSLFAKKIKEVFINYEVILICYTNNYCNYLVPEEEYGKYFETFNSRCMKGEADNFINKVIQNTKSLL